MKKTLQDIDTLACIAVICITAIGTTLTVFAISVHPMLGIIVFLLVLFFGDGALIFILTKIVNESNNKGETNETHKR